MDNINNSSNINNKPKANIPKNLPKQLPPELLKAKRMQAAQQNAQKLQSQPSAHQQPSAMPQNEQPKQKSLDDLLDKNLSKPQEELPEIKTDNVVHQSDKQLYKTYNKAVADYRKALKSFRKKVVKNGLHLNPVKNVFFGDIPDSLWFFNRRKIRNVFNKLDMIINRSVTGRRGWLIALVVTILITAIIGTIVYFAFIITKNLSRADTETVGDISLNFADVSEAKGGRTRLNIEGARLNQNLEAHPKVFNNTNIYLYVRFYIKLDYVRGKDYIGVNIRDLSAKGNVDDTLWWYDDKDGMSYYLFTLAPGDNMTLFNSFQIVGRPNLETAWQGKSLNATIYVEVCQFVEEGQEFPPSWATYWTALITNGASGEENI